MVCFFDPTNNTQKQSIHYQRNKGNNEKPNSVDVRHRLLITQLCLSFPSSFPTPQRHDMIIPLSFPLHHPILRFILHLHSPQACHHQTSPDDTPDTPLASSSARASHTPNGTHVRTEASSPRRPASASPDKSCSRARFPRRYAVRRQEKSEREVVAEGNDVLQLLDVLLHPEHVPTLD